MAQKRIEYIDALRGFTMVLVVLGHIELISFCEQTFLYTPYYKFFRMPLFFFISGYIAFRSKKVWDTHTFLKESIKKLRIQLIPTLIFGLTFTCLFNHGNIKTFIEDISKNGYWFTIALLEMFLVYYTANYLSYILFRKQQSKNNENNEKEFIVTMFVSVLFVYLIKLASIFSEPVNKFMNITSFYYLPFYFPHFIFGVTAAKYKSAFEKTINNSFFMAGVITIFFFVLYFRPFIMEQITGGKELSACALSFTGIFIVYNFFRKYQGSFSNVTKLGTTLQYIGKRTLDIYLLHHFFLPYIPKINHLLGQSPNLVLELTGFLLSFLVIGCCLLISNIIRLSDFLAYWLFGVKKKTE